jgi:hypothetical protein
MHQPIISEELFAQCIKVRSKRRRTKNTIRTPDMSTSLAASSSVISVNGICALRVPSMEDITAMPPAFWELTVRFPNQAALILLRIKLDI